MCSEKKKQNHNCSKESGGIIVFLVEMRIMDSILEGGLLFTPLVFSSFEFIFHKGACQAQNHKNYHSFP